VLELNLAATRGLVPDRTFVLLLSPEQASSRVDDKPDRIEREPADFQQTVDDAYRGLAAIFPQRIVPLDATRPATELADQVREHVRGN
jgi:dTMP kinase